MSYINSTDSSILNLESNNILNLSNYINSELIENNLFRVFLSGVKNIWSRNFSLEDIINFVFDYYNLIKGEAMYTIEIAAVVQESSYS